MTLKSLLDRRWTSGSLLLLACGYALAVALSITVLRLEFGVASTGVAATVVFVVCFIPVLVCVMLVGRLRTNHRRVAESEQRFRRAMQDSPIGVAIVALDGRIVETNRAFAAMLGYTPAEMETRTFFEITHPDDLSIGKETMEQVRAGKAHSYSFEKRYLHKDGTPVWARLAGSVICDDDSGKPLYLVSQIESIDTQKRSEARIAEAETRWNFALASAGQGVWELDMRKGGVSYSATWKDMLGYGADELDGDPDLWLKLVHPDDLDHVMRLDRDHLEGRAPLFEAEFRMRRRDGSWIWILDRGRAIERDDDGNLIRAIGTLTDITGRKKSEERLAVSAALLAEEKERLRVTLQSIGDAVICADAGGHVTFVNPAAEKLIGVPAAAALGQPLASIYRPVDEETGAELTPDLFAVRSASNARAVLVRRDGSRCSIREMVTPILTEAGESNGLVVVFQDFTDARTLQRELLHAASHDGLTGLSNRASFLRQVEGLLGEVSSAATAHQFLYLDLDHFKAVNDTGGHAAGDAVLKNVADLIRASLRPGDLAARLGGDEFAIVFKSCPVQTAGDLAGQLVEAIKGTSFGWAGRTYTIGASGGLATITAGDGAVDAIIARADEACYSAKASGRGCVAVAGVETTETDGDAAERLAS